MVGVLKAPSKSGFLDQTSGIEMMFPVAGIALVPGAPSDFSAASISHQVVWMREFRIE